MGDGSGSIGGAGDERFYSAVVDCSCATTDAHDGRNEIVVLVLSALCGIFYICEMEISLDIVVLDGYGDSIPDDKLLASGDSR